jgi:hypothetical protein
MNMWYTFFFFQFYFLPDLQEGSPMPGMPLTPSQQPSIFISQQSVYLIFWYYVSTVTSSHFMENVLRFAMYYFIRYGPKSLYWNVLDHWKLYHGYKIPIFLIFRIYFCYWGCYLHLTAGIKHIISTIFRTKFLWDIPYKIVFSCWLWNFIHKIMTLFTSTVEHRLSELPIN